MLNPICRRRGGLLLSAMLLGCGAEPGDASSSADADFAGPSSAEASSVPTATGMTTPPAVEGATAEGRQTAEVAPNSEEMPVVAPPERLPCSPPPGVSGSPRDVEQLVALLNSLPRPTTLTCFLESLERPLALYLTRSEFSLQPADGERSPRTFIVQEQLALSVVASREHGSLLEIGYGSTPGRSIKGEIEFPLRADVTHSSISDRIRLGDTGSICGACHGAETRPVDSFFIDGAFESAIAVPLSPYEVSLERLQEEALACDPAREPERCGLLSALFDHGAVERSSLWDGR